MRFCPASPGNRGGSGRKSRKNRAGFASNGSTYYLRIVNSGTTYTCCRSDDGEAFTEMFAFADTGIEAQSILIDAYTGMTAGYKFTLK